MEPKVTKMTKSGHETIIKNCGKRIQKQQKWQKKSRKNGKWIKK